MKFSQVQLRLHHFDLPLRHAFGISRFTHSVQPSLIVELTNGEFSGFGEATADPYYNVSISRMTRAAERASTIIASTNWEHPNTLWQTLEAELSGESFVHCAIDQAAHDLWGKASQRPTYEMLGLSLGAYPDSSFTIGLDRPEVMVAKLKEESGWPIYKIKLGTNDDLKIVRALRECSDAVFRVDANCGWTPQQAIDYSFVLKELGVEFIEQPLPAEDWVGAQLVYHESALPIVADESCLVASDIARCVGHFHAVNIKMVKCGGITPALKMIDQARQSGMKVMLGCMTESSVGISAIAQLLPLLDYVDIDGANLLATDIASGVMVEKGRCRFSSIPGNGVEMITPAGLEGQN